MKAFMCKRRTFVALAFAALSAGLGSGCSDRKASSGSTGGPARPFDAAQRLGTADTPKAASAEIDELVRANLDAELLEQPIAATWLGVHAADDRVDDVRPEA